MLRRRPLWRAGGTCVAAAGLALVSIVPAAFGADADPSIPSPPESTATAAPTTSPTTATSTSAPATTTAPRPTRPSTPSGSTTMPGTTLPPVDDATIGAGSSGYSAMPAPLIPSISDDPLFHAARSVDDGLVTLSKTKAAYLKQIAATRKVADRAASIRATYDKVRAVDDDARRHLTATRSILRAAALHAYTGFGSVDTAANSPEVTEGETVLPYRTYVRVTIADARRHVSDAEAAKQRTGADERAARANHRSAQTDLRGARAEQRAAKQAVTDAEGRLEADREALRELIAANPDMAPGILDRLPDDELPEGAIPVESPVGTIVVPADAEPRTAIALQYVVAQIGKPYLWGGTGPNAYDCSGLLLRAFQAAGNRKIPRVSQSQQLWVEPIDEKDVQPGDLVFFGDPAYHVGIYIGGDLMIDAPFTGARVRVDKVWSTVTGYGRPVW